MSKQAYKWRGVGGDLEKEKEEGMKRMKKNVEEEQKKSYA